MISNTQKLDILLLEDNDKTRNRLTRKFSARGHKVESTQTIEDCRAAWDKGRFDVIVLDRIIEKSGCKDEDSLTLLEEKRRDGDDTCVLFVTGLEDVFQRVEGIDLAADYVTKPYAFKEVMARLEALIVRQQGHRIKCGPVEIWVKARKVFLEGKPVRIGGAEFDVLRYLAEHEGQYVSKEELFEKAVGKGLTLDGKDNLIQVKICRIRGAFKDLNPSLKLIKNAQNKGYKFQTESILDK